MFPAVIKLEKETSDSPDAALCISIENIRTVSCKEENIEQEIKGELSNEMSMKLKDNYNGGNEGTTSEGICMLCV